MKRTVISIRSEVHKALKIRCAQKGIRIGKAADEAILTWIKTTKQNSK